MIIWLAAVLLAPTTEYLVVDGIAVGQLSGSSWAPARPLGDPVTLGASEVGIANAGGRVANVRFLRSAQGSWVQAIGAPESAVLFTGKAWVPREASPVLDRSEVIASVVQFARNRGVVHPQPYLVKVLDIDLDGDGRIEQIIEATSNPRASSGEPKWQVVLLRTRDRVYPLSMSFPKGGESVARCRLRAVADFDGDGRMELVSTAIQDSLFVSTVWTFREGKLLPVVDTTVEVSALLR